MISFSDVSFGFPQKDLYNKISFSIEEGDHAALIGSSGTGKSTLLEMVLDDEKYLYEGKIKRAESMHVAVVTQFVRHETDELSVFEFLAEPFVQLQKKNDELCDAMGTAEDMDAAFAAYQACMDELDALDAYNHPSNIRKQLSLAGMAHLETVSVYQISGGEYKMLAIMRSMLQKPSLLIMDEPDVFLDFENLIGLSKLINDYKGTILTVTHNRLLLSQCFDKILHLENEQLQEFPGSFAQYQLAMLDTKIRMQENAAKFDDFIQRQEKVIKGLRELAENTADPAKGRQLKARVSYLERIKIMRGDNPFIEDHAYDFTFREPIGQNTCEITDRVGLTEETSVDDRICDKTVSGDTSENHASENHVSEDRVSADHVSEDHASGISVSDFTLVRGNRELLQNVSFSIAPGEKVAIVGDNGTGKSSLLTQLYGMKKKEAMEQGKPLPAFFTQIYDSDDKEKLSGGERNIRQLLEIRENPSEILFLDEPTSHLDIYAQLALEEAINVYKGTVLMVSHDFYLVTDIADRILILENNGVREMSGRAYRKSIYKQYFASDLFEQERKRKELEMRINSLLRAGKHEDARKLADQIAALQ